MNDNPFQNNIRQPPKEVVDALGKELPKRMKAKPIPDAITDINRLVEIAKQYPEKKIQFLFTFLFLTGQRITEALSVSRRDITREMVGEKEYIIVKSRTLKNRTNKFRNILIPTEGPESRMANAIWNTIKDVDKNALLFGSLGRKYAWRKLSHVTITDARAVDPLNHISIPNYEFKVYPHFLRHCRASFIVEVYNPPLTLLMQMFGWSSPSMPNVYVTQSKASQANIFAK